MIFIDLWVAPGAWLAVVVPETPRIAPCVARVQRRCTLAKHRIRKGGTPSPAVWHHAPEGPAVVALMQGRRCTEARTAPVRRVAPRRHHRSVTAARICATLTVKGGLGADGADKAEAAGLKRPHGAVPARGYGLQAEAPTERAAPDWRLSCALERESRAAVIGPDRVGGARQSGRRRSEPRRPNCGDPIRIATGGGGQSDRRSTCGRERIWAERRGLGRESQTDVTDRIWDRRRKTEGAAPNWQLSQRLSRAERACSRDSD